MQAVIISTEPLVHYAYAKWALSAGLNILMDKPITARKDVVSNLDNAKGIGVDYLDLLHDYNKLQKNKQTAFIINTQRRFHPGFQVTKQLLSEIARKTNCPVTSINSIHCDGQWRLPSEMVTQIYHPYNCGYGKASHSGYHFFDAVYQFYQVSRLTNKVADSMEIYSSFLQPRGFLFQLNQEDYEKYFGEEYKKARTHSDKKLYTLFKNYGEVDLSAIIRLKKKKNCVGNITISLLHNGFSMRTWVRPGADLYKGNGRVKHEYHNIQQGPFQNIQIHSYQSKDKHDFNTYQDYELGGNNHFDIYVFRNKGITGDKESLKIIRMNDLKKYAGEITDETLAMERAKHKVVIEFLSYLQGIVSKNTLSSNIEDHLMPVQIMSGVYRSHNKYMLGENPLISYKLNYL